AGVLVDGEGTLATLHQAFPAIHSDADWWVPVNCGLLRTADANVLVDAGAGPKPRAFFPDGDARLLDELDPEEVDAVVLTHLHIDHVGWTGAFPNARPAPGHTPGHMIMRAEGIAVVGDFAAHELQIADPDLVFVNDMDADLAAATRRRVIAELAED